MKKFLLSFLLIASSVAAAWAVTDGVAYERVNDIGIKNLWIQDRAHTSEVWSNQPYCNTSARTAVMKDGYIYIARSNANTVILGTDTLAQSVIYKVNAANGELVKELALTLDGEIYGGATLSSNTVGVDNFGHLYMAPFSSALSTVQQVYMVDKETGELVNDANFILSWDIRYDRLPQKIYNRNYEHELVELIKDNYVILITASPYETSFDSLKHIQENTELQINESYWNFRKRPPELKRYWMKKAVIPTHGDNPNKYLAIESNKNTRAMYKKLGIEARPKGDFI